MKEVLLITTFYVLNILNGFAQLNYGLIPQDCQVRWTKAGLLSTTPTTARHLFNVEKYGAIPNDGQDDYSAVMAAINAAQNALGVSIVFFPEGYYDINSTIEITNSNIILQGAGSDKTTIRFNINKNSNGFYIHGIPLEGTRIYLTANIPKGSMTINGPFSNYSVGNWIQLCEYTNPKAEYGNIEKTSRRFETCGKLLDTGVASSG